MRGISSIIITILLLMISVSLASFGYIFFTQMLSVTTQTATEVSEHTSTSLLAEMKIDSISGNDIFVRNTGKVDLTQFEVYINDILVSSTPIPPTLDPGEVATITLASAPNPGDVVKVTTAQGAIALKSA
jgi:FlaG/FlaF family flagellin (archaellin)